MFRDCSATDTITDFDTTRDCIDLSDFGGGTITLTGLTAASELAEDMFVLDKIAGSDDVDDMVQGGGSDDTITGGTGADTFVFAAATTAIPRDTRCWRTDSLIPGSVRPARIDRARLPAYVGTPAARWESGYPSDCKSAYTGSNPVRASRPSPSGLNAAIRARIRVCSAVAQW